MTQEKRIDFNKLSKPANLQNSAVLKMLEEEEQRKKLGKPGLRRVEWPPTKEGSQDCVDFVEQSPVQSKTRGLGEYATYQSKSPTLREESGPKPVVGQPANYQASPLEPLQFQEREQPAKSWTPGTPTSAQQPREYVIPVSSSWKSGEAQPSPTQQASKPKSWAPVSPVAFSPQPATTCTNQPHEYIVPVSCTWKPEPSQTSAPKSWSSGQQPAKEYIVPVSCPWKNEAQPASNQSWNKPQSQLGRSVDNLPTLNTWKPQQQQQHKPQIQIKQTPPTPPTFGTWSSDKAQQQQQQQSGWNDYPQQHTLTVSQEVESPQSYKPHSSAAPFEPPATLIHLRSEAPISQEPSPVYFSQPAATEAGYDGTNMRGDQKWPPASVKEQTEAENQARIDLAKGPACRPRKVNKDYTGFFAQHAVTNNYPGYRAPPGTQFFTPQYQQ